MLASPYYGSSGEVIEIDVKQSRVRVQLHVPPQPDLHSVIDKYKVGFLWEVVCFKKTNYLYICYWKLFPIRFTSCCRIKILKSKLSFRKVSSIALKFWLCWKSIWLKTQKPSGCGDFHRIAHEQLQPSWSPKEIIIWTPARIAKIVTLTHLNAKV